MLEVILGNPAMIAAYQAGGPGDGTYFPDGAKMVTPELNAKKSAEAPFFVRVPDALAAVEFMEKDSKRFADSGGRGYAYFSYDVASDTFTPTGNDAKCGAACHTIAAAKDEVFRAYPKR